MRNLKYKFNEVFKHVDWILLIILFLSLLTPLITRIIRITLLSFFASTADFSISQSWIFINLFYESVRLLAIIPAYAFINKGIKNKTDQKEKTILALFFVGIINIILFIFMMSISYPLARQFLAINPAFSFIEIYSYFLIISLSMAITLFSQILIAFIILNKQKITFIIFSFAQLAIAVIVDVLLLTPLIFNELNLLIISLSSLISAVIFLIIQTIYIYSKDVEDWNAAISNLEWGKWSHDYGIYWKSGFWLFLEAFIWNTFWMFGVALLFLRATPPLGISENVIWLAFSITDSLFWIFLFLPMKAVDVILAEALSTSNNADKDHEIVKGGMGLSVLVVISWIFIAPVVLFGLFPLIISDKEPELLNYITTFSLLAIPLFIFQLPSKVFYTYFATTGQGFKILIGTFFGVMLIWFPVIICEVLGYNLDVGYYWIGIVIYGIGMSIICLFYAGIYYVNFNRYKKLNKNTYWEADELPDYNESIVRILEEELPW